MKEKKIYGHLLAFISVFIWGITFISTKILLKDFSPLQIMFFRFTLAYLTLFLIQPKFQKIYSLKQEFLFVCLGLTGISLYFVAENLALKYTYASNVSLVLSTAPILTAFLAHFCTKDEKFNTKLLIGFFVAMLGVFLVVFNGKFILKLNPLGDLFSLLAALIWAIYSILLKLVDHNLNPIYVVRKTFLYGIVTTIPIMLITNTKIFILNDLTTNSFIHLLFLSLLASALCFIFWNKSVKLIGAVKANNYIYIMPMITLIASSIFLNEKINFIMIIGSMLILIGVYVSTYHKKNNSEK